LNYSPKALLKIKRYLHLSARVTQLQITFSQVTQLITNAYLSVIKTTHFQIRAAIKDIITKVSYFYVKELK